MKNSAINLKNAFATAAEAVRRLTAAMVAFGSRASKNKPAMVVIRKKRRGSISRNKMRYSNG